MFKEKLSRVFNRLKGVEVPPPGLRVMNINHLDEPVAEHSFENKQALVDFLKTTTLPAGQYFDVSGQDLSGTDLSGLKLRNLRARGTIFKGTKLENADLSSADLTGADMRSCQGNHIVAHETCFRDADLRGAKLMHASLLGANMLGIGVSNNTDFEHADARDVNIRASAFSAAGYTPGKTGVTPNITRYRPASDVPEEEAGFSVTLHTPNAPDKELRFHDADAFAFYTRATPVAPGGWYDLSGRDLKDLNFTGADLGQSDFTGADLTGADFSGCVLNGATLDQARAMNTRFKETQLRGIKARNAQFGKAAMNHARLDNADLTGSDFSHTALTQSIMTDALCNGCNFDNANAMHVDFTGADLMHAHAKGADFEHSDMRDAQYTLDLINALSYKPGKTGMTGNPTRYKPAADLPAEEAGFSVTLSSPGAPDKQLGFKDKHAFAYYTRITPLPAGAGYDLAGRDLQNVNFLGAKLGSSDLSGADIQGADFSTGSMQGARLDHVKAATAQFKETDMQGVQARDADFTKAGMGYAKLDGATLNGSDFSRAALSHMRAPDTQCKGCVFNNATAMHVDFTGANLLEAQAKEADFEHSDMRDANYTQDLINALSYKPGKTGTTPNINKHLPDTNVPAEEAAFSLNIHKTGTPDTADRVVHFRSRADFALYLRASTPAADEYYDLTGADLSGLNLGGANLKGAILHNVNLSNVDVSNADFDHAQMQGITADGVNFSGASLKHVNATGGSFKKARLNEANITRADFSNTDLTACFASKMIARRAKLRNSIFENANMMHVDFRGADLTGVKTNNSTDFEHADIRSAKINPATIKAAGYKPGKGGVTDDIGEITSDLVVPADQAGFSVTLRRITDDAESDTQLHFKDRDDFALYTRGNKPPGGWRYDLSGQDLSNLNFQGANLQYADLSDTTLKDTDFSGARMAHVVMEKAQAQATTFTAAQMPWLVAKGADFTKAKMIECNLASADFTGAICKHTSMARIVAPDACFETTDLSGASLSNATLRGARMIAAHTNDSTDFEQSDLTNADFNTEIIHTCRYRPTHYGSDLEIGKYRPRVFDTAQEFGFSVNVRKHGGDGARATQLHFASKNDFALFTRTHRLDGRYYYDLSNMDLSNLNFSSADLLGADMTGANVTGSFFSRARMSYARMDGIDASKADFSMTNLDGVSAANGNFGGAVFAHAACEDANFSQARMRYARMAHFSAIAVNFTGADFRNTSMAYGNFQLSQLDDIQVNGSTSIEDIDLRGASYPDRLTGKAQYSPKHTGTQAPAAANRTKKTPDSLRENFHRHSFSSPVPIDPRALRSMSRKGPRSRKAQPSPA